MIKAWLVFFTVTPPGPWKWRKKVSEYKKEEIGFSLFLFLNIFYAEAQHKKVEVFNSEKGVCLAVQRIPQEVPSI